MIESYSNYEWFLSQDFEEYSGKWLAIIDKRVVAIGDDVKQIIQQIKQKYPHKKPFITKVRGKLSIL